MFLGAWSTLEILFFNSVYTGSNAIERVTDIPVSCSNSLNSNGEGIWFIIIFIISPFILAPIASTFDGINLQALISIS